MKCANCGADIPAGMLICPDCGTEVQMVPDYNPLDDVLTREVKGSVEDVTRPLPNRSGQVQQQRNRSRQQPQNSTRVLSQGELDRIRSNQMRTKSKHIIAAAIPSSQTIKCSQNSLMSSSRQRR